MANLVKEISISTENKPGMLAKVSSPIKEAGVGITACCAWGEGEKANFLLLTDNNQKAIEALKKSGFSASEKETVAVSLPHKVGALAEAAQKLGQAGIDIQYLYVSAAGPSALVVFSTNNNRRAVEVLG
jgi:hypothetical protein